METGNWPLAKPVSKCNIWKLLGVFMESMSTNLVTQLYFLENMTLNIDQLQQSARYNPISQDGFLWSWATIKRTNYYYAVQVAFSNEHAQWEPIAWLTCVRINSERESLFVLTTICVQWKCLYMLHISSIWLNIGGLVEHHDQMHGGVMHM